MSAHHHGGRWQRLSLSARERDGWRCTTCGKAGRLEAHHVHPVHLGGDDSPSNLRTLCRTCHVDTHRRRPLVDRPEWAKLLQEMQNVS